MRRLVLLFLSFLLLAGPFIGGLWSSAAVSASEQKGDVAAEDTKASGGCGGKAFIGKFGDEPVQEEVDPNACTPPSCIPPELIIPEGGTDGEQGAAGDAAAGAAGDAAAGAAKACDPPKLNPDECDVDCNNIIWCNEKGVMKSNCTELPAPLPDGTTVTCP